jgi:hypothetical protein
MKNLLKLTLVISLFLLSGVSNFAHALTFPLNGTDQTWTANNVIVNGDVATITDDGNLYKGVLSQPGNYTFSFDYITDPAWAAHGSFTDLFSVSIYFNHFPLPVDTNGDPIIDPNDPTPIAVLDVDFKTDPIKGWFHISLNFDNPGVNTIIPAFEIINLNDPGNSTASVKNVYLIAQVPESSSIVLVFAGILGIGLLLLIQERRPENFKTFI